MIKIVLIVIIARFSIKIINSVIDKFVENKKVEVEHRFYKSRNHERTYEELGQICHLFYSIYGNHQILE